MSDYIAPTTGSVLGGKSLTIIGLSFAGLGFLALLAPVFATATTVVFLAATLLVWGLLGDTFVIRSEAFPNRLPAIVGFGLIAAIGLGFLIFPGVGAEVLTIFAVAGLLIEGVLTILYAISRQQSSKGLGVDGFVRSCGSGYRGFGDRRMAYNRNLVGRSRAWYEFSNHRSCNLFSGAVGQK